MPTYDLTEPGNVPVLDAGLRLFTEEPVTDYRSIADKLVEVEHDLDMLEAETRMKCLDRIDEQTFIVESGKLSSSKIELGERLAALILLEAMPTEHLEYSRLCANVNMQPPINSQKISDEINSTHKQKLDKQLRFVQNMASRLSDENLTNRIGVFDKLLKFAGEDFKFKIKRDIMRSTLVLEYRDGSKIEFDGPGRSIVEISSPDSRRDIRFNREQLVSQSSDAGELNGKIERLEAMLSNENLDNIIVLAQLPGEPNEELSDLCEELGLNIDEVNRQKLIEFKDAAETKLLAITDVEYFSIFERTLTGFVGEDQEMKNYILANGHQSGFLNSAQTIMPGRYYAQNISIPDVIRELSFKATEAGIEYHEKLGIKSIVDLNDLQKFHLEDGVLVITEAGGPQDRPVSSYPSIAVFELTSILSVREGAGIQFQPRAFSAESMDDLGRVLLPDDQSTFKTYDSIVAEQEDTIRAAAAEAAVSPRSSSPVSVMSFFGRSEDRTNYADEIVQLLREKVELDRCKLDKPIIDIYESVRGTIQCTDGDPEEHPDFNSDATDVLNGYKSQKFDLMQHAKLIANTVANEFSSFIRDGRVDEETFNNRVKMVAVLESIYRQYGGEDEQITLGNIKVQQYEIQNEMPEKDDSSHRKPKR